MRERDRESVGGESQAGLLSVFYFTGVGQRTLLSGCWALLCLCIVSGGLLVMRSPAAMPSLRMETYEPETRQDPFLCTRYASDPATLCPQGRDHWPLAELTASIPAFAKLFRQRPLKRNKGGMNANHAFALWFTARELQPRYVIESGVNHGQTTWLLRQVAGPDAHIFSLDPDDSNLQFRDTGKTTYFMGRDFIDLSRVDWSKLIPLHERNRTLVLLDDHMSSIKRVDQLLALGFVHLVYDDNWKHGDCYSFNTVCSEVPTGAKRVLFKDDFGRVQRSLSLLEHQKNLMHLQQHMEVYFEFPPLFGGCLWQRDDSLLTLEQLQELGLPSLAEDERKHTHMYPPYVKLKPRL